MNQKRPTTFEDALKILDEALVQQHSPELRPLLADEYTTAKVAIGEKTVENAHLLQTTVSNTARDLTASFKSTAANLAEVGSVHASKLASSASAHAKRIGSQVDTRVRANPWPVIGGVAFGALAFGILLARKTNAQKGLRQSTLRKTRMPGEAPLLAQHSQPEANHEGGRPLAPVPPIPEASAQTTSYIDALYALPNGIQPEGRLT